MTTRTRRHLARWLLWTLVLCNIAMIFFFSSEPADASARTSLSFTEAVVRVAVHDFPRLPPVERNRLINAFHIPVRKAAHAAEFALLGLLLTLAWAQYPLPLRRRLLLSLGITLTCALLDELLQRWASLRSPSLADAGLDLASAAFGILLPLISRKVRTG